MTGHLCRAGAVFVLALCAYSQEFSGAWRLNPSRSEIRGGAWQPDLVLKLEQREGLLRVSGAPDETAPVRTFQYPLNGSELRQKVGEENWNTRAKWEGSALLVNTIVTGARSYTVMERWRVSRDGRSLRLTRTVVSLGGETESVLLYENEQARQLAAASAAAPPPVSPGTKIPVRPVPQPEDYSISAGTRVLLRLVNPLDTRHASPGDRVYLETEVPVFSSGRLIMPRGSQVAGIVTESRRSGRVSGKASVYLRFDSITLPGGVTRSLASRVGAAEGKVDGEGKITGEGAKGRDARTAAGTTAAGASIGSIATRTAAGAGIGAAAGAAAGLIGILGSRGPDVVLPRGTTMEMVLDRELRFTAAELEPGGR
jgi:hypothetical protein